MEGLRVADPLQKSFDDLVRGRASVDSDVRSGIRQAAPRVQLLHLYHVRGERPTAIPGDPLDDTIERQIEPGYGAVVEHGCAQVRIDERAASGGNDDVSFWQKIKQHLALDASKIRLPILGKYRRYAAVLPRLYTLVDVFGTPADASAKRRCDRGLPGTHESDEIQLICPHTRSDSSTEKNSGYDTAAAPAPWIVVGPVAPRAAIANAMARR